MKKLYVLSGLLLIASFVPAQDFLKKAGYTLSADRPDSALYSYYDGQWVTRDKFMYSYDDETNTKQSTAYHRETDSHPWQPNGMTFDVYDENNNPKRHISLSWNPVTITYENFTDGTYTFNSSGKIVKSTMEKWNNGSSTWDSLYKSIYIYTDIGDSMIGYSLHWNASHQNWDSTYKSEVKLTATGKDAKGSFFRWNTGDNGWELSYDYEILYDDNQNDTLYKGYHFNDQNVYECYIQLKTVYDIHGRKINETYYELDNSEWKSQSKTEYQYNESGYLILRTSFEWDENSADFKPTMKQAYYYPASTGLKTLDHPEVLVYPNPATDFIAIKMDKISSSARILIYNLNGSLLLQQNIRDQERISVSHIPGGVYLYEVRDGEKIRRGKISVEK